MGRRKTNLGWILSQSDLSNSEFGKQISSSSISDSSPPTRSNKRHGRRTTVTTFADGRRRRPHHREQQDHTLLLNLLRGGPYTRRRAPGTRFQARVRIHRAVQVPPADLVVDALVRQAGPPPPLLRLRFCPSESQTEREERGVEGEAEEAVGDGGEEGVRGARVGCCAKEGGGGAILFVQGSIRVRSACCAHNVYRFSRWICCIQSSVQP